MPLSFASMFGGTLTLIGTSTNILAPDLSGRLLGRPFTMFEFTQLGAIPTVVGTAYLLTVGRWLTPARIPVARDLTAEFEMGEYLTEVVVREDSPLVDRTIREALRETDFDIDIIQVIRGDRTFTEPLDPKTIRARRLPLHRPLARGRPAPARVHRRHHGRDRRHLAALGSRGRRTPLAGPPRNETLSSVAGEPRGVGPWGSGILRALGARHPGSNPGGPSRCRTPPSDGDAVCEASNPAATAGRTERTLFPAGGPIGSRMSDADADEREKLPETDEEWRERLTDEEYRILRERGTEPKFSGEYLDVDDEGDFRCAGCRTVLFSTDEQFDSGHGWPSFVDVVEEGTVETRLDTSHGMRRTEVVCATCGGHLGHVFDDGPEPTGKRYCINSAALDFEPDQ